MGVKVTNNAYGTLSAGIASGDTTITLDGGQGARFPSLGAGDYFYATLVDTANNIEVVKVTARSSDSMTVVRGQDNTTAKAYAIGDRCELRPTAALFNDIQTAIDNVDLSSRVAKTGDTMTGDLIVNTSIGMGDRVMYDGDSSGVVKHFAMPKTTSRLSWGTPGGDNYRLNVSGGGALLFGVDGDSEYFAVETHQSGVSHSEGFRVDSYGRVIRPKQPFALVRPNNGNQGSYTNGGNITCVWGDVLANVGNNYNSGNGRFTCPVAGLYMVTFNSNWYFGGSPGSWIMPKILKNGAEYFRFYQNTFGITWHQIAGMGVLQCSAGDYLQLYNQTQSGTGGGADVGPYSHLSFQLIG